MSAPALWPASSSWSWQARVLRSSSATTTSTSRPGAPSPSPAHCPPVGRWNKPAPHWAPVRCTTRSHEGERSGGGSPDQIPAIEVLRSWFAATFAKSPCRDWDGPAHRRGHPQSTKVDFARLAAIQDRMVSNRRAGSLYPSANDRPGGAVGSAGGRGRPGVTAGAAHRRGAGPRGSFLPGTRARPAADRLLHPFRARFMRALVPPASRLPRSW